MANVNVVVGRLDNNKRIEVEDYFSISSALAKAGFTKADNEVIQDINGEEYNGDETVQGGTGYYLVQKVKSGM